MFDLLANDFLLPSDMRERLRERTKSNLERRLALCEPWHPKMPWTKEMNLKADSYSVLNLFPDLDVKDRYPDPNTVEPGCFVDSPSGEWRYVVNRLPKGTPLSTWNGSKIGSVLFDGPVGLPAVYSREKWNKEIHYRRSPWMSLTPAEIMSMRPGTRLAKGHTVVAGLGLGHILIEVSKKRSVKKVTLVEVSQELVSWLYPHIKPHLKQDVEVIIGDAYKVIPELTADVALIDIAASYGNKSFRVTHPNINRMWVWGSAAIGERHGSF